jgi:7-carboxy-7-deazaguanine synthase
VLDVDVVTKGYLSEIFVSFQGEGLYAGRRQLFIRLSGCHMRCRYCDTPGSLERGTHFQVYSSNGECQQFRNPVSPSEVLAHALPLLDPDTSPDGVAVTGGEPLLQADFLAELLADARWPRPRLLETSGTLPEKLAPVLPVVDVVSMDIKLPSNTGEPECWEAHRHTLAAARGKAYVKILVDDCTALGEVERAAELVRAEAREMPVFLQPISDESGRVAIRAETLDSFFAAARSRVADVRVAPQMHRFLGIR